MNKKSCKEALDIYKKFLEKTDQVSQFLKVAESSGMDKSEIPDLTKAPSSLLEALESHVNGPDATRRMNSSSNVAAASNGVSKCAILLYNVLSRLIASSCFNLHSLVVVLSF